MLNHITLMGRLVRDPELRRTQGGVAVVSFCIAVDRDFGTKDDGSKETDFINITAWRNTAEFVSKYFAKGRMAVVSGRLQMRSWTDNNGQKRVSAEVVADNVYFGDSKPQGGGNSSGAACSFAGAAPVAAGDPVTVYAGGDFAELTDDDEGLPF